MRLLLKLAESFISSLSKGLELMGGMTNGQIEGNVTPNPTTQPPGINDPIKSNPSILGKIAFDRTMGDFRGRLSASYYSNSGDVANTLYLGDRAGSHYSMVMEQARSTIFVNGIPTGIGPSTTLNNKDSGRLLPILNNKVTSIMINPFIKFKGLEFFGGYEIAKGRCNFEKAGEERTFTQMAAELVYRFLPREQCYIGARYVTVTGQQLFEDYKVTVSRTAIAAGWFPIKNIELKGEYVMQDYKNFTPYDYQYQGKFSGFVLESVVAF